MLVFLESKAPDQLQQFMPGKRLPWMAGHQPQQIEFLWRQLQALPANRYFMLVLVDNQVFSHHLPGSDHRTALRRPSLPTSLNPLHKLLRHNKPLVPALHSPTVVPLRGNIVSIRPISDVKTVC